MGNQAADHHGMPAEGEVRFNSAGRLETFDGTEWVPLQRLSDSDVPQIFRGLQPTHDETDNRDSPASP